MTVPSIVELLLWELVLFTLYSKNDVYVQLRGAQ